MSCVLVIMEQRGGAWNRMSLETLAAGQELAAAMGVGCSAAVVGGAIQTLAAELAARKLDKIFAVEAEELAEYTPDA
ncbi:MAG: electron transfer flavoprotein subunit alpha/FixB family protein, partial [Bryobacterales bacterium]|nr:electron transfer flavoprotein subunit alpha/FixB family protein [Bryobacterales bacterium]